MRICMSWKHAEHVDLGGLRPVDDAVGKAREVGAVNACADRWSELRIALDAFECAGELRYELSTKSWPGRIVRRRSVNDLEGRCRCNARAHHARRRCAIMKPAPVLELRVAPIDCLRAIEDVSELLCRQRGNSTQYSVHCFGRQFRRIEAFVLHAIAIPYVCSLETCPTSPQM